MSGDVLRIGILASGAPDPVEPGGGSTADRVTRDSIEQELGFQIGVVVCNNPENKVAVYDRFAAINHGYNLTGDDHIDVVKINSASHPDGPQPRGQTASESAAICRLFEERSIDFCFMLGYSKVVTTEFLQTWCWQPNYADEPGFEYRNGLYHPKAKTSNNHPCILPFSRDTHGPGAHEFAIKQRQAGRLLFSAITWHLATEQVDGGPIIDEEPVPMYDTDTATDLEDRAKDVEKEHTARVLQKHLIFRQEHLRART